MDKRYAALDLSKMTGVQENTIRRYSELIDNHLDSKWERRAIRYMLDAVAVIQRVNQLYDQNYSAQEIDAVLDEEIPAQPAVSEDMAPDAVTPVCNDLPAQTLKASNEQFEVFKAEINNQVAELRDEIKAKDLKIEALEDFLHHNHNESTTAIQNLQEAIRNKDSELDSIKENMNYNHRDHTLAINELYETIKRHEALLVENMRMVLKRSRAKEG